MPKHSFFYAVLALLLLLYSCRKPSDVTPQAFTGCRITLLQESEDDTTVRTSYHIYYNNDGTVQRIYRTIGHNLGNLVNFFFTYRGNYIKIRQVPLGSSYADNTDSLIIDSLGRVERVYHMPYSYSGYTQWELYTYDGAGNMIRRTNHNYSNEYVDTFQWQDGDLVRFGEDVNAGWGSVVYSYTYAPQLFNTGNISARFSDFEKYGRGTYTPRHLYTSEVLIGIDTNYHYYYDLDATGKITHLWQKPGDGGTVGSKHWWATYSCQ